MSARKQLIAWIGGIVATLVLVGAGAGYMVVGMDSRAEVRDTIAREGIVGTPDMRPGGIEQTAVTGPLPTCSVAGEAVDTGAEARCFAEYMRIHALESTDGQVYAEMGRFLDDRGRPTSDESKAAVNPETGRPVENGLRNLWVTETALATGLNMSFFAEQVGLFAIVMGACMVVIGLGLGILTLAVFGFAPWRRTDARAAVTAEPSPAI
jgi:hypothetical protein